MDVHIKMSMYASVGSVCVCRIRYMAARGCIDWVGMGLEGLLERVSESSVVWSKSVCGSVASVSPPSFSHSLTHLRNMGLKSKPFCMSKDTLHRHLQQM